MSKSPIAVCVTTLLILSTGPAFAMDWDSGPYFGASLTRNDADFGITTGNGALDFDETGFKVVLGHQTGDFFRVEAGYVDFGELDDTVDLGPLGTQAFGLEADGYDFAAILALPISDDFSVYAKGGLLWWDATVTSAGLELSDDGRDSFFGVGAQLEIGERIALFGEYEEYSLDNMDIGVSSLGLTIKF